MIVPLSTAVALLVELLRGPGYGLELIERVRVRGGGRILLRQGVVYPTLRDLLRRKLLRGRSVTTPGSGRPRTYYELTRTGIAQAQAHRAVLTAFASTEGRTRLTARQLQEMRERLFECGEATEAARWLREAGRSAGR